MDNNNWIFEWDLPNPNNTHIQQMQEHLSRDAGLAELHKILTIPINPKIQSPIKEIENIISPSSR
jgi:hypothetical protein